jgi:transposase
MCPQDLGREAFQGLFTRFMKTKKKKATQTEVYTITPQHPRQMSIRTLSRVLSQVQVQMAFHTLYALLLEEATEHQLHPALRTRAMILRFKIG